MFDRIFPAFSVVVVWSVVGLLWGEGVRAVAQEVGLPAPRLLTLMPMGGEVGSEFEVAITGDYIDAEQQQLVFSNPKLSARAKTGADGKRVANQYIVTIAADAPTGLHEARMVTRLGVSASRAFVVGTHAEVLRKKPNTTMETALSLPVNSVCSASVTAKSVDYFRFEATKGQRFVIDCSASKIDSKLTPVVIVADAKGAELIANRTGGSVEFTAPADGAYFVKVHGLTFQGGAEHFYRLALLEAVAGQSVGEQPAVRTVSSVSWNGVTGLSKEAKSFHAASHDEKRPAPVSVSLPCRIEGRFFPAARVDTYEFEAKKGEVWWVEVASERLGYATDAFLVVQRRVQENAGDKWVDVVEMNDIPSPMKPSTNGYSYDGPPYDAGSADPHGKIEVKEDGLYRLQIRDLFGGTKANAKHVYTMVIRQAAPDYALVAWGLHMTLRNGDRNALSKPMALRAGATMAMEVVVVRKDGFSGEVELSVEGLPEGVSAEGLKIPAGKSRGMILLSAREDAKPGLSSAKFSGKATINGASVVRPCAVASMAWPVKDSTQEIPKPRLVADAPVSVTSAELAPVTLIPTEKKVLEVVQGEKLTVPLKVTWRSEFSGTSLKLKTMGDGFDSAKEIDVPLKAEQTDAVLDLAALKTVPGEYTIAFYGPGVVKYRDNPDAVKAAEEDQKKAQLEAASASETAKKLAAEMSQAPVDKKEAVAQAVREAAEKQKAAETAKLEAEKRMKAVSDKAAPKDTADIVVSEPIRLIVKAAEKK